MLYLFFGEDSFQSRENLHIFLNRISSDEKRSSLSWFNPDNFLKTSFEELMRAKNLFGGNCTVVCEGLLKDADTADFLKENLKFCAASENIFIFWEEILESFLLAVFKKYAAKIEEFKMLTPREAKLWLQKEAEKRKIEMPDSLKEELIKQCGSNLWLLSSELEKYGLSSGEGLNLNQKTKQVNIFHISDAVAERDRGRAWLLFQKAIITGLDPEEIFWKIVWQIKNLLLIKKLMPLTEKKITEMTRLHPFVVKKTAAASRLFTNEELTRYSSELIGLYHGARRGKADFDVGIEKFLINL
jgi:DNA polymerase III delta subunit